MTAFTYTSSDGTRVTGWRNDVDGPAVVISNGLGTPPEAWPAVIDPAAGFRVATWYYRGTGGGDRPADPSHVTIADHVDDLIALMDHEGMDQAVLAAWSLGVNIAFEAARRHPERVAGILAVAGVPGGTFDAMFGPIPVPRRLRHPLGYGAATVLKWAGPAIDKLMEVVPLNRITAAVIRRTGVMAASTQPDVLLGALAEFKNHEFRWYFTLAQGAAKHEAMDLSFVACPVTLVAGRMDIITSMRDIVIAADQIPHAEIRAVKGTHFLPLERPEELRDLLAELVAQAAPASKPRQAKRSTRSTKAQR